MLVNAPFVRRTATMLVITLMFGLFASTAEARDKLKVGDRAPASTFAGAKLVSGTAPPSS